MKTRTFFTREVEKDYEGSLLVFVTTCNLIFKCEGMSDEGLLENIFWFLKTVCRLRDAPPRSPLQGRTCCQLSRESGHHSLQLPVLQELPSQGSPHQSRYKGWAFQSNMDSDKQSLLQSFPWAGLQESSSFAQFCFQPLPLTVVITKLYPKLHLSKRFQEILQQTPRETILLPLDSATVDFTARSTAAWTQSQHQWWQIKGRQRSLKSNTNQPQSPPQFYW